jgi:hypothetical protein
MTTKQQQRDYIRELARQIAEIAASPKNEEIKRRWRDVNALRRPDRAPVWCRPAGCWSELLPDEALKCQDPWLRRLEIAFRRDLIKHDIGDDTPMESYFGVHAAFDRHPKEGWGVDTNVKLQPDTPEGGWYWVAPLKTEADYDKLVMPRYSYNPRKTQQMMDAANDLLGDILPVKLVAESLLGGTLGGSAQRLRGLTQMMLDCADSPELMHRLMRFVTDTVLKQMDVVEATGLLTPNNEGPMNCSDPVGPPPVDGKYGYKNQWIMANSQEFDQIGPRMWEEFLLNYQKPIFARYGLVGYGCCENLTSKIDGVLTIPNLRIFVCSGWTNLDKVIEKVGKKYTIMWRQKASEVVFAEDVAPIRAHLENGLKKLQGHYIQIVLRELQTLRGNMDRLHLWTRTAQELAAKYA